MPALINAVPPGLPFLSYDEAALIFPVQVPSEAVVSEGSWIFRGQQETNVNCFEVENCSQLPRFSPNRALSHVYQWMFWFGNTRPRLRAQNAEYPSEELKSVVVSFEGILAESLNFKKNNYMTVASDGKKKCSICRCLYCVFQMYLGCVYHIFLCIANVSGMYHGCTVAVNCL